MLFGTLASQLEMLSLGLLAGHGVDAFTLFSPTSEPLEHLDRAAIESAWEQMDLPLQGALTKQQAARLVAEREGAGLLAKMLSRVRDYGQLFSNPLILALFFLVVATIKAFATFFQGYATSLAAIRVSQKLRQDYFEHIQTLPMSFYHEQNIGSLSVRVSGDAGIVALALNSMLTNYLQTPFTLVTTLSILYFISPRLFFLIFLVLPLLVIPIWVLTRKVKQITKAMQKRQEQITNVLYEFIAGIQTIKSYAMEELSSQKYDHCNKTFVRLEEKGSRYGHSLRPILHFFGTLFIVTIILWGFYVAHLSLSEILVFCGLLSQIYEPIKKFADENLQIQKGVVSAERIDEILQVKPDLEDRPEALVLHRFHQAIRFEQVSFRYHKHDPRWILHRLNLEVRKGEFIAIVGPTGVGKSTLAQLLLRLYDVEEGAVTIDGVDVRDFTQKSLRGSIGYVPQKPFLFLDTVAANIAFSHEIDLDRVKEAAQAAFADGFIEELPQGYNTVLHEMGKDLSGGQQQRLALARALYKEASILVLDEATSALDVLTEEKIKHALSKLQGQKTLLVIAHRLSTVADADRFVFMEGEGVRVGTKEELFEHCEGFAQMWRRQMAH